ncbi:glycosyltransferase 87 family protein [Nocardia sp. 2YAB30]|uniref:glycosyltransferase 87 family protein n=1 Tax=unclassified Nocardia TaxID=2637762 RepID=UPI003F960BC1
MRNSRSLEVPRTGPALFVLVGSALVALVLVFTTVDPWLDRAGILAGGLDVHVYRDGAWRVLHGHPLYTEPSVHGLLYTYTPFSTLAFIPIDLLPWGWVTNTWLAVNLVVLFGCIRLSWRILGYRLDARSTFACVLLAITCAFMEPVRTTLYYGQINLVLMLLVLWDCARGDRGGLRGLGVGVAAGIKLVPLYFVAHFIALRQWRAALTASATFVASVGLAWAVLPADSWQYWSSTFLQSDRIALDTHPANQSLRGAIAHLTGHPAPMWLWLPLAGAVAATSLVVTARLHACGERLLAIVLAGLTACAISPFSWGHHWVWFVPLLVHVIHKALTRPGWWIGAAALYVSIGAWTYQWSQTYVSVGLFLYPPWWPIAPILLNGYVVAYAAVLVGAGVALLGRRSEPDPDEDRSGPGMHPIRVVLRGVLRPVPLPDSPMRPARESVGAAEN